MPNVSQETVTPLSSAKYELRNVTGTSGWTKNLKCYRLEHLPN